MSDNGAGVHNKNDHSPQMCSIRPMPRKFLRKYLPDPAHLREHKHLRVFGERLADPNLWHLNRRCVANGAFIGMFCALLPMPFQMLPAGMLAILFRANMPLSIALVWLTNPLTAVPVWYGTYMLGSVMLGMEPSWHLDDNSIEAVSNAMLANFGQLYVPMLLGSLVVGLLLACVSWFVVHQVWRRHTLRQWKTRQEKRRVAKRQAAIQSRDDKG